MLHELYEFFLTIGIVVSLIGLLFKLIYYFKEVSFFNDYGTIFLFVGIACLAFALVVRFIVGRHKRRKGLGYA